MHRLIGEPVVLSEYRSVEIGLDRDVAQAIAKAAPHKALTVRPLFEPNRFELSTKSWVGTIDCGSAQVLIKPKVSMHNVVAMLVPSIFGVDFEDSTFDYSTTDSLTEAMAGLFANEMTTLLRNGLRLDYRQEEERLTTLRGRIDHRVQCRTPILTPLACRFEEYSIDTEHNRLLKAAVLRMLRMKDIGSGPRAALARTLRHLTGAGDDVPRAAAILARPLNRLNAHYEKALQLACIIIDSSSTSDGVGSSSASTFLVDMNQVFERYMTEMLRRSMPTGVELVEQYSTTLDIAGDVSIYPDLVLRRSGQPFAVADLKYIQPGKETGKNDNLFQIVSYCDALGVDTGTLIYVAEPGFGDMHMVVRVSGKTINVVRVDVSSGMSALRESIRSVAIQLVGSQAEASGAVQTS